MTPSPDHHKPTNPGVRAHLSSEGEPMVALVGEVVPPEVAQRDDCLVLYCGEHVAVYPEDLRPLFVFLAGWPSRRRLDQFLQDGGAPDSAVQDLLNSRIAIQIPPNDGSLVTDALSGVRLESLCFPIETIGDGDGQVLVGSSPDATEGIFISVATCIAMWEALDEQDLRQSSEMAARQLGIDANDAARAIVHDIRELTAARLARLELVDPLDGARPSTKRRWFRRR